MSPIVSPQWLNQHLSDPRFVILDASIPFQIPTEIDKDTTHIIPGARRFDYDHVFANTNNPLPHMMPDEAHFNQCARELGINQDAIIVVYDNSGTYASPRAWWMWRAMGHQHVHILDGGLTAWKAQGYPVTTAYHTPTLPGNFSGTLQTNYFVDADYVHQQINTTTSQTVDARAYERFSGAMPEPREGLRSGHIPASVCLPFSQLMNQHQLKSAEDLKPIFASVLSANMEEYIFSCGSGVTACIVLLAASLCGYENLRVYDGSWTEWGQLTDYPVETANA